MTDEGGRLPGDLLHKVFEHVLTRRILRSVAIPALADLQDEGALVATAPRWRRAFVLARGYLGLWSALALCLASWPARSLREDWLAGDAPGPRLLRALTPRVGILGLVLTFLLIAHSARTLDGAALWGLPEPLSSMSPSESAKMPHSLAGSHRFPRCGPATSSSGS